MAQQTQVQSRAQRWRKEEERRQTGGQARHLHCLMVGAVGVIGVAVLSRFGTPQLDADGVLFQRGCVHPRRA